MLGIFNDKKEEKKEKKVVKKAAPASVTKSLSVSSISSSLILMAHTSEKAVRLAGSDNQYTFKVHSRANKNEVKKQIEKMFGVKVESVRILIMPDKIKTFGRRKGVKSGYKKAIVSLKKGDVINPISQ